MCVCTGEAILLISIERMGRGVLPHQGGTIQNQKQLEEAGARGFLHTHIHTHRKEMNMSNQPEHDNQQPETITSEEMRQSILTELEASKQEIAELNDDQLMEIAGAGQGIGFTGTMKGLAGMACCAAFGTLHKALHDPENIHGGTVQGALIGAGAVGLYHVGSTLVSQAQNLHPKLKRQDSQNGQEGTEMQPLVPGPHNV